MALCFGVYDLIRVRLRSVGPAEAHFEDVILDLRDMWADASGSGPRTLEGVKTRSRPARLMVIVGENGVGKSTLLGLISSVLVRPQELLGARVRLAMANQGPGHVVLEWRHSPTGDLLITGLVVRPRPDAPGAGMAVAWYSFQPSASLGLENLPFEHSGSSDSWLSFRERLGAALRPGDRADLTWAVSREEWLEHLRGRGFNVRWSQWMADHPLHDRTAWYWTDERFIAFVLGEAIADERLARLTGLADEYVKLRDLVSDTPEVTNNVLLTAKQSAVSLLETMIEDVLAALEDVQRLSRLPDDVPLGFGGNEFFRITCRHDYEMRRTDRLTAALDGAAPFDTPPDGHRLLLRALLEVTEVAIEILAPNRSTSGSARYLPLSQPDGRSGYEARISQLISCLVADVVAARLGQTQDGEAPDRPGIVILDDQLSPFTMEVRSRFLEIVLALDLQLICTSPWLDPDLFVEFSSIVLIRSDRDPTSDKRQVRVTYPAGLAPVADDGSTQDVGMTGVMDRVPFEDVFDVHEGVVRTPLGEIVGQDGTTAHVLTAQDVRDRTAERPGLPRVTQRVRESELLQPGDFVLARMWDRGPVPITVISPNEPPKVASESVLVLRPRHPLRPGEQFFYLRYISSDHLLGALAGRNGIVIVTPASLRRQRIPRPDGATLNAITELTSAAGSFRAWQRDADDAIHSFFQWSDPETARSHMIEAGRLTRQRREAASVVNEIGSRLRATLPYPIARRWREVQASRPDEVGYTLILECAEAAIAYCAVLGIMFAREAQISLQRIRDMQGRVRRGNAARMTFGTWHGILREVSVAVTAHEVPNDSPLTQFRCFADGDVAGAIRALHELRNKKSHRRGPATHEINDAVIDAHGHLETVLSGVEWLVDYPLRTIDMCRWDSFTNSSQVTYRELMGDHNIVSPAEDRVTQILETGSPYITDSYGHYRLLRPFLLIQPCPDCGQLTTFILDQWNATNQETEYLALDHSATITVTDMQAPLRQVGFV